jgi:hypothetical protein
MGLFENERSANARSCVVMIEDALRELGHDPTSARADTPEGAAGWRFQHGSASVTVQLVPRQDYTHLRVTSPVMSTDSRVDVGKLYRRLLQLNAREVHGVAFAAELDEVQLVAERTTIDLDRGEVLDLIRRVRDYADHYDDLLVDEFGGRLGAS